MASEHNQNPFVNLFYICSGAIFSLVQNADIYYQHSFDLIKAFLVGGMGSLGAYVFKTFIIDKFQKSKANKYLKEKSKDVCK